MINLANPKFYGYRVRNLTVREIDFDYEGAYHWVWLDTDADERMLVEMPNDNESYSERSRRQQSEQDRFDYLTGGKPT